MMDIDLIGFIVSVAVMVFLVGLAGHHQGMQSGMVKVASGEWVCRIEPNQDLTTEWVCKETKSD